MATAEVFQFAPSTNLLVNPVLRFSPQPILLSTPDRWYVRTNGGFPFFAPAQIRLPHLNATTGPLYNGKTVVIIVDSIFINEMVEVAIWNQLGVALPPIEQLTPLDNGSSYTATAIWDQATNTGGWQWTKN